MRTLKLEHEVKLQTETSLLSNIWFYIKIQQEKCWDLASQSGDQQRPTGQSGQAELLRFGSNVVR